MVPDFLTIVEAGRLIERKELSPIELIESRIDRITRLDGSLNSFICVLAEQALAEARAAEAEITSGHYRGPLHGIPIGLKDLYETAGVATGEYVRYTRKHRYDVITFSNFLTTRAQVIQFKQELQTCARFLRHRGILLVIGAKDSSSKYKQVYQAVSDVVLGANYSSSKLIAWCESTELEPRVLGYRWNDPYGERLKKQLQSVYEVVHSRHAELIPPAAATILEASIKPGYDKPIEWQVIVFRKHARPRGPRRANVGSAA
jgi:hypothetical protein